MFTDAYVVKVDLNVIDIFHCDVTYVWRCTYVIMLNFQNYLFLLVLTLETFKCNMCNYKATAINNLSRHSLHVHEKRENINCSECNKTVKKWSLYSHMKTYHTERIE